MEETNNISTNNFEGHYLGHKHISKEDDKLIYNKYKFMIDDEIKTKFWIKTLLSSYNAFPEIAKTIDKIIDIQASNVSFASDIFSAGKTTLNQVEKVIDLTERKNSIINIYYMTKELIKNLEIDELACIEKRYIYNWSIDELAREYETSPRTIYRKLDKLINTIYHKCKCNNWSLKFIESQTTNESWLQEKYIKNVVEYIKNSNYKLINTNINSL